jgi:protein TonB
MKTNYQNTAMLDIVFENRNKSYGAYALRSDYDNRMSKAIVLTLTLLLLIGFSKYVSARFVSAPKAQLIVDVVAHTTEIDVTKEKIDVKPKVTPPPAAPAGVSTIANPEMKVTANNTVQDSMPTHEQLQDFESGLTTNITDNHIGVTDGRGEVETFVIAAREEPVADKVFVSVEEMPEYPGGESALLRFVASKTIYPDMEHDLEMEGKALLKFVVNEDGSISNVSVLKADSKGFGIEGKRVVGLLSKFKPGKQQGKPVKVQYVLPFQFKLGH